MQVVRPPRKVHHILPMPELEREREAPFGREVAQEVDFLIELMDLKHDEAILDVAAGAGRHALELARRRFRNVTAVDLSDQLLSIGRKAAEQAEIEVRFVKGDPRRPAGHGEYDAALVLGGGAFGLMENDAENQQILDASFEALKPGGRLALSAMNLFHLIRHMKDLSGFDPTTNYLTTTESVQIEGDVIEELPLNERYYAYTLLQRELHETGFRRIVGFGADPGRYSSRSITTDDSEILVYAIKPK